jgi:hypothetical protein
MTQQERTRVLRHIGEALNSCHNCVATDLIEVEPEPDRSWRIDNAQALDFLDELAAELGVNSADLCVFGNTSPSTTPE